MLNLTTKGCKMKKSKLAEAHMKKVQKENNKNDAEIIESISFDILGKFDAEKARCLIMQPENLINLIQNSKHDKHELTCFYAVHAILLALVEYECAEILSQMPDYNIETLKQCIAVVKKHPRPDAELIENMINERLIGCHSGTDHEDWINDNMIKSLKIAKNIECMWDDAVAELQRWDKGIGVFKRSEPVQELIKELASKEVKEEPELWSMDELAAKLGSKSKNAFQVKKCAIIKAHPDRADEINNWFVRGFGAGKPMLFKPGYFKQLQSLWGKKTAQKNVTKQNDANMKTDVKPCIKELATDVKTDVKGAPVTLVDLKGFEAYIKVLQELCKNTEIQVRDAESEYAKIAEKIPTADSDTRRDLLERALAADKVAEKHRAALADCQTRLDCANNLLQDRNRAMAEINAANAKIAQILQEFEQSKQH